MDRNRIDPVHPVNPVNNGPSKADDGIAVPGEALVPFVKTWIEQWNGGGGAGNSRLNAIGLVQIAARAGPREVF